MKSASVEVPGILYLAPDRVIISEKTFENLKTELRLLKGDIKCCEIEEIKALVPHIGAGKLDASKHLLEHIEAIERLLGIDDEKTMKKEARKRSGFATHTAVINSPLIMAKEPILYYDVEDKKDGEDNE